MLMKDNTTDNVGIRGEGLLARARRESRRLVEAAGLTDADIDKLIDQARAEVEVINDPILVRFRAALGEIYGKRLERVVLFGSRARGDARVDSDYDVAVFLTSLPDRWVELDRLADLRLSFLDETGVFFDALPYAATTYEEESPLMGEIRREGLDV